MLYVKLIFFFYTYKIIPKNTNHVTTKCNAIKILEQLTVMKR